MMRLAIQHSVILCFAFVSVMIPVFAQESLKALEDSTSQWLHRQQFEKVRSAYNLAQDLYIPSDTTQIRKLGKILSSIAHSYQQQAKHREAIEIILTELSHYRSSPLPLSYQMATCYNNLSFAHSSLGDYSTAEMFADSAIQLAQFLSGRDNQDVCATAFNQLGILRYFQKNYSDAQMYFKQSLRIREDILDPGDTKIRDSYQNVGVCYTNLNEVDSAKFYLDEGLQHAVEWNGRKSLDIAGLLSSQARLFLRMQEYERAKYYFLWALDIKLEHLDSLNPMIRWEYNGLTMVADAIGDYEEAATYNAKYRSTVQDYDAILYAKSFLDDAQLYYKNYQYNHGLESAYLGLELANQIQHPVLIKAGKFMAAANAHKTGNIEAAGRYLNELEEFSKGNLDFSLYDSCQFYTLKVHVLQDMGEVATAEEALHLLEKLVPKLQAQGKSSDLKYMISFLASRAELSRVKFGLNPDISILIDAIEDYRKSLHMLGTVRQLYEQENSRESIVSEFLGIYEHLMASLLELYHHTGSSYCLEEVNTLMQLSHNQTLREITGIQYKKKLPEKAQKILSQLQIVRKEITVREQTRFQLRNLGVSGIDTTMEALNSELVALSAVGDSLLKELLRENPSLTQILNDSIPSISEIQTALTPQTALVNYFLGNDSIFIVGYSSDSVRFVSAPLHDLVQDISLLHHHLNECDNESGQPDSLAYYAHKLYNRLIDPVQALIHDRDFLIIKPSGALGYIPFSILLARPVSGHQAMKHWPYLLHEHAISYTTSIWDYMRNQAQNVGNRARINYAGFAPSYDSLQLTEQQEQANSDVSLLVRSGYLPLPKITQEVESVHELFSDGALFLGKQATKEKFQQTANNYAVLHLAMHAITEDEKPSYSRLIFSEDDPTNYLDRDLMSSEIYGMELNNKLVVLSACNTGLGKLRRGEGVLSMGRAFTFAGVSSLVMSLWSIPDRTTADIIYDFFSHLQSGLHKSNALRQAQLDFLKENKVPEYDHPFYWAGLVQTGNIEPLILPQKKVWTLILRWSILVLVSAWVVRIIWAKST